jgi:hypothetical protein
VGSGTGRAQTTSVHTPGVEAVTRYERATGMGRVGQLLGREWRRRGVWLAGSVILLFGLLTLGRGVLPLDAHASHRWLGRFLA